MKIALWSPHVHDASAMSVWGRLEAYALKGACSTPAQLVYGERGDVPEADVIFLVGLDLQAAKQDLAPCLEGILRSKGPIVALNLRLDPEAELCEDAVDFLDLLGENGRRFGLQNLSSASGRTAQRLSHTLGQHVAFRPNSALFLNPNPKLGRKIAQRAELPFKRIGLVPLGAEASCDIEQSLASLVQDAFARGHVFLPEALNDQAEIVPHLSPKDRALWEGICAQKTSDPIDLLDRMRTTDLITGAQSELALLGLQAERPALAFVFEGQHEAFCHDHLIPHVTLNAPIPPTREALFKAFKPFDGEKFDRLRAMKARAWIADLEGFGLSPSPALLALASEEMPA